MHEFSLNLSSFNGNQHVQVSIPGYSERPVLAELISQASFIARFFPLSNDEHMCQLLWHLYSSMGLRSSVTVNKQHISAPSSSTKTFVREEKEWGYVDVIYETHLAGLYRLVILPGKFIPAHRHWRMSEAEMVVSDTGLDCCGRESKWGDVYAWPKGVIHMYTNRHRSQSAEILCIDSPPFIPEDELPLQMKLGVCDSSLYMSHPDSVFRALGNSAVGRFRFPGAFPNQSVDLIIDPKWPMDAHADAVLVFVFDEKNELFICRHLSRGWEIPGGKVERGETAKEAAIREAREEAGILIVDLKPLGRYVISEPNSGAGSSSGSGSGSDSDGQTRGRTGRHTKQVFSARSETPLCDAVSEDGFDVLTVPVLTLLEAVSRSRDRGRDKGRTNGCGEGGLPRDGDEAKSSDLETQLSVLLSDDVVPIVLRVLAAQTGGVVIPEAEEVGVAYSLGTDYIPGSLEASCMVCSRTPAQAPTLCERTC